MNSVVAITRRKSIATLYAQVAEYDLVIVPDPPLASALNRRIDHPRLGPFATTPRRHVDRRQEGDEARRAFQEVLQMPDTSWKELATAVEDVIQCWEYDGTVDAILEYEHYDRPTVRDVVSTLASADITASRLASNQIDSEQYPRVAVVGEGQLTPLEHSYLPETYDSIPLFTSDTIDTPTFDIFDSPAAIADALVGPISPESAENVGIVLESGSEYATLIQSALEAADIPYRGGPGVTDKEELRHFIALLNLVFASDDIRVRDVRGQLHSLKIPIDIADDDKRLFDLSVPALSWVSTIRANPQNWTLRAVIDAYEQATGAALPQFRTELETVGILDERLAEPLVDRLTFYVETYDIPIDREDHGVLLADAHSGVFVDRPTVFYLGLDEGWTQSMPERPWIDRDATMAQQRDAFQSLIQSGREQHFLVVDVAGGIPVTPTSYFEECLEEPFNRFGERARGHYGRRKSGPKQAFDRSDRLIESDPASVETLSQSRLNTVVVSPRAYLFDQLLPEPDRSYFAEGSLFHDFAEFYCAHSTYVTDANGRPDPDILDSFAELMVDAVRPFYRTIDLDTQRTRYRCGLEAIATFLATEDCIEERQTGHTPERWDENVFGVHTGREVESAIAEQRFENKTIGIHGIIDLLAAPDHIVDFKSGSKHTPGHVTKRSAIDPPHPEANYQALLYLTYLRAEYPGQALQFTFFHFLDCLDEVITGTPALTETMTTIKYRPVTYAEFLRSEAAFDGLCEEASNDCKKSFSTIDQADWLALLESHEVPRSRVADDLIDSAFFDALTEMMQAAVGDYKYVASGCEQACRYLAGLRNENYFADDIDEFESFVATQIETLNAYHSGTKRFPVVGLVETPDFDRVAHRDLLLAGEHAPGKTVDTR